MDRGRLPAGDQKGHPVAGHKAVGLDIGTTCVRAAELSWTRNGVRLDKLGQVGLPPGAVRDGEVVEPEAVTAAIKQLWAQAKFTTKKVIVGIANQKVVVRQVDLPWMPADEMRKSLAFQVADVIPMAVDEAILDYHALEEVTAEDGARQQRILLVAAGREMVSSTLAAITAAGLHPAMVDLTPFALMRSLGASDSLGLAGSAEALVEVGASITNIVVHQGGVPRFVRMLLQGGADITESLSDQMGISGDEAESLKLTSTLPSDAGAVGADPASRVLETAASAWIEEVRGSLDYYLAQPDAVRLDRIVLSGGGAQLRGLAYRLAMATGTPVDPAQPISRVAVGSTGLSEQQIAFLEPLTSVPVGLALGAAA